MTTHEVVSRDQWIAANHAQLLEEKAWTRDAAPQRRQGAPPLLKVVNDLYCDTRQRYRNCFTMKQEVRSEAINNGLRAEPTKKRKPATQRHNRYVKPRRKQGLAPRAAP